MKDLSIYFENQRVVGDFKPGQLGTSIVQAGASFYQDSPETGIRPKGVKTVMCASSRRLKDSACVLA